MNFLAFSFRQSTESSQRTIRFFPFLLCFRLIIPLQCRQGLCFIFGCDIQIDHRSLDMFMAKQERYLYDIHAIFKPMGSLGMAQLMGMEFQWNICTFCVGLLRIFFQHFICRYCCQFSVNTCIP